MEWAPLLSIMVAAVLGDTAVVQRARQLIASFTERQHFEALGHALHRILEGDRDPNLVTTVGDPTGRAIIATVLIRSGARDDRTVEK
jgi:hypothetical protein